MVFYCSRQVELKFGRCRNLYSVMAGEVTELWPCHGLPLITDFGKMVDSSTILDTEVPQVSNLLLIKCKFGSRVWPVFRAMKPQVGWWLRPMTSLELRVVLEWSGDRGMAMRKWLPQLKGKWKSI